MSAQTGRATHVVVVFNDDHHHLAYVIQLLVDLFRHSGNTAEGLATLIHHAGRAVVAAHHLELAELKAEQIREYGTDPYTGCREPLRVEVVQISGRDGHK